MRYGTALVIRTCFSYSLLIECYTQMRKLVWRKIVSLWIISEGPRKGHLTTFTFKHRGCKLTFSFRTSCLSALLPSPLLHLYRSPFPASCFNSSSFSTSSSLLNAELALAQEDVPTTLLRNVCRYRYVECIGTFFITVEGNGKTTQGRRELLPGCKLAAFVGNKTNKLL